MNVCGPEDFGNIGDVSVDVSGSDSQLDAAQLHVEVSLPELSICGPEDFGNIGGVSVNGWMLLALVSPSPTLSIGAASVAASPVADPLLAASPVAPGPEADPAVIEPP
jgi:hypothetical protein